MDAQHARYFCLVASTALEGGAFSRRSMWSSCPGNQSPAAQSKGCDWAQPSDRRETNAGPTTGSLQSSAARSTTLASSPMLPGQG